MVWMYIEFFKLTFYHFRVYLESTFSDYKFVTFRPFFDNSFRHNMLKGKTKHVTHA